MPRRKTSDPLLDALIKRLPPSGTEWPADQQIAWLHLTAISFATIYGGDAAQRVWSGKTPDMTNVTPIRKREPKYPFLIDAKGYARAGTVAGRRVLAAEVEGEIVDLRGPDADPREVIWADNTNGITELDAVIVTDAA